MGWTCWRGPTADCTRQSDEEDLYYEYQGSEAAEHDKNALHN